MPDATGRLTEAEASLKYSRITPHTFETLIWFFYALAMLSMAIRTVVRIRLHKKLQLDDYLLLFASICLTAATIFLQLRYWDVYRIVFLSTDPIHAPIPTTMDGLKNLIYRFVVVLYVYIPLTWTSIFAAKFSYLWFFRKLVDRIRPLLIYWWVVTVITALVYVICVIQSFVSCPYLDERALRCASGKQFSLAYHFSLASMTLDIITDFLIVSISICLLWRVKIKTSQKLGLAVFLCLSIVMAVLAIVRVSNLRIRSTMNTEAFDGVWQYFWQQVEACFAVCLVSLTAFRFLFIAHQQKKEAERAKKAWFSETIARMKRKRQQEGSFLSKLPAIPSGTLTGMRTFISGGKGKGTRLDSTLGSQVSEELPVYEKQRDVSQIYVTRTFRADVHEVKSPAQVTESYRPMQHYRGAGESMDSDTSIRSLPPVYNPPSRNAPEYTSRPSTDDEYYRGPVSRYNGSF